MRRKRALFLLEVVIAMALVALFSVYFLRSSLRQIYQEKKGLLALEFERICDLRRMDLIEECWAKIEQLAEEKGSAHMLKKPFPQVQLGKETYAREVLMQGACKGEAGGYYHLVIEEVRDKKKRTSHFLVRKEDPIAGVVTTEDEPDEVL